MKTLNSSIVACLQQWGRARNLAEGGSGRMRLEFWRDQWGHIQCDFYDMGEPGMAGLHPFRTEVIS